MTKLTDVVIIDNHALGTIVNDSKCRFTPGSRVLTSRVIDHGDDFIQTLNTRYEVEKWKD